MVLGSIQNRWQAFGFHLGISVLIFITLFAVIYISWYPGPLLRLGAWEGITIVAAVDFILGPVLTLVVFNRQKKSLPFDLSVIALIQVAGLAYGMTVVENQRPIAKVLLDGKIYMLTKHDFSEDELNTLATFDGAYPKFVFIDMPEDKSAIAVTLVTESIKGTPLETSVDKYLDARDTKYRERVEWRLAQLNKNESGECTNVDVTSVYYSGEMCLVLH